MVHAYMEYEEYACTTHGICQTYAWNIPVSCLEHASFMHEMCMHVPCMEHAHTMHETYSMRHYLKNL